MTDLFSIEKSMTSFDGRERYSRAISFWIWTQTREREKTFHFVSSSFFLLYSGRIHREFVCLDGKVEYVFSFWKCDGFSPSSFTVFFSTHKAKSWPLCCCCLRWAPRASETFLFLSTSNELFCAVFPVHIATQKLTVGCCCWVAITCATYNTKRHAAADIEVKLRRWNHRLVTMSGRRRSMDTKLSAQLLKNKCEKSRQKNIISKLTFNR